MEHTAALRMIPGHEQIVQFALERHPAKRLTVTRTASTPKAAPAPVAKVTTARKSAPKPKATAAQAQR